jgi:hypothetical protein
LRHLGVLALLAACSANESEPIALTHDACAPLALVSTTASTEQLDGMAAAQALWRDRGAPALGLRAGATLEVHFEDAAPLFHGFYDDTTGLIYINTDLREPELAIVIAHEVGHAFGLLHVTDRDSLMKPGNLATPPTAEDQQALAALWGSCE